MHLLGGFSIAWAVATLASGKQFTQDTQTGSLIESQTLLDWHNLPHRPRVYELPPLREQAKIQDGWTKERIESIPGLMRKHNVSAWLISQREYVEEILFWSIKSATQFSARRRTTYLFLADPKAGNKELYTWVTNTPDEDLWPDLKAIFESEQLDEIAVNADPDVSFASGLRAGELAALRAGLGEEWGGKLVSAPPMLSIEVIGTMVESKTMWYTKLMGTAWAIISEAFSAQVIKPGTTTTTDVEWWMRERLQEMHYTTWFPPSVTIVEPNSRFWAESGAATEEKPRDVIMYGDMLHVDFGVTALGMNTDTQHLAYVLYPGETEEDVPEGLIEGLRKGNRVQDIVRANMKVGLTGNEILKKCREEMDREGIVGRIYSHPVGDWGHSAGTVIGMTNLQDGVPVIGEFPLIKDTFYSVELGVEHFVPERNATIFFPLEEDVRYSERRGFTWVWGQQKKFHVIKTPESESASVKGDDL